MIVKESCITNRTLGTLNVLQYSPKTIQHSNHFTLTGSVTIKMSILTFPGNDMQACVPSLVKIA